MTAVQDLALIFAVLVSFGTVVGWLHSIASRRPRFTIHRRIVTRGSSDNEWFEVEVEVINDYPESKYVQRVLNGTPRSSYITLDEKFWLKPSETREIEMRSHEAMIDRLVWIESSGRVYPLSARWSWVRRAWGAWYRVRRFVLGTVLRRPPS